MTSLGRPPRRRRHTILLLAASGFLAISLIGLIGSDPTPPRLSAAASPALDVTMAPADPGLVLLPQPARQPTAPAQAPASAPDASNEEPGDERDSTSPALWRLAGGPPVEIRVGRAHVLGAPVHLADGLLDETEAGDLISLAIPDLGSVDVEIERIAEPSEGITVLQGHLADPDESWPVSLTRGPGLVLANVTTPTGTWIAEFSGGSGWIAHDDLEDRLVDHSVSDARDPIAEGHAPEHP